MSSPRKERRLLIEYRAKMLVKSRRGEGNDKHVQLVESDDAQLRWVARIRWLEIVTLTESYSPKYEGQLVLAFCESISPVAVKCFFCDGRDSETHCYPFVDRFICETCCEIIADEGGW
jgi:hypothetical protein